MFVRQAASDRDLP